MRSLRRVNKAVACVFTGRAVGAAIAGVLNDAVGPRNMFRFSSVVSFSFINVLLITERRRTQASNGMITDR